MRPLPFWLVGVLVASWTVGLAWADETPLLLPTRDVDVTYRMPVGARTLSQRMRWNASARLMRVDPPGQEVVMVMNYAARTIAAIDPTRRTVIEGVLPTDDGGGYRRLGTAVVVGLGCVEWATRRGEIVCISEDGVLLRMRRGEQVAVEATAVTRVAQPASVFVVPSDYQRVTP